MKLKNFHITKFVLRTFLFVLFLALTITSAFPAAAQSQTKEDLLYIVREGDTLREIARSFNTSVEVILDANQKVINDPDLIYAGEVIIIPEADAPPRAAIIGPTNGKPGTEVTIYGRGYKPGRELQLLIGPQSGEVKFTQAIQAEDNGRINSAITIPNQASPGEEWVMQVRPVNDPLAYREKSNLFLVEGPVPTGRTTEQTNIYLVALGDAGKSGQLIGCQDSLLPVQINVDVIQPDPEIALRNLLQIDDQYYGESGLYNALHNSTLSLQGVEIDSGTAHVYLEGEKELSGVCDQPRFEEQIIETANQFPSVEDVVVYINDEIEFSDPDAGELDWLYYTVHSDDTLSQIAASFDVEVEELMSINPQIERPGLIITGQEIAIPSTDADNQHVVIRPTNGIPGTIVQVSTIHLLPNTRYRVLFGVANSEASLVDSVITDPAGNVSMQLTVPETAEANEYWVVVFHEVASGEKIFSNLYEVD